MVVERVEIVLTSFEIAIIIVLTVLFIILSLSPFMDQERTEAGSADAGKKAKAGFNHFVSHKKKVIEPREDSKNNQSDPDEVSEEYASIHFTLDRYDMFLKVHKGSGFVLIWILNLP